jgi:hypothetical protein
MRTLEVSQPVAAQRTTSSEVSQPVQLPEEDPTDDCDDRVQWSVEAIVKLHLILLSQLSHLAEPATPLEEKLELLQWVYTEREFDNRPFSFANCVKLCGRSINPHFGLMTADDVREELAHYIPRWLEESLALYPAWVRQAIQTNPEYVWTMLSSNPQFINKAARRSAKTGDLFNADCIQRGSH